MSTESGRVRASDAEREDFAALIREAVGEGRFSLAEGDERLAAIYATKFRDELQPLVTDIPAGVRVGAAAEPAAAPSPYGRGPGRRWDGHQWEARRWDGPTHPRAFVGHLAAVVAVSMALVGLWVISGAHFFWPAIPLIFFAMGLVRHARWRAYRR